MKKVLCVMVMILGLVCVCNVSYASEKKNDVFSDVETITNNVSNPFTLYIGISKEEVKNNFAGAKDWKISMEGNHFIIFIKHDKKNGVTERLEVRIPEDEGMIYYALTCNSKNQKVLTELNKKAKAALTKKFGTGRSNDKVVHNQPAHWESYIWDSVDSNDAQCGTMLTTTFTVFYGTEVI